MANVYIGTCSWKYESWKGIVYSDNAKTNYLLEYSKKYNSVEIDQWFWSLHGTNKITLPLPEVVEEYSSSIPNDFKFTVKLPNSLSLTHFYKKQKSEPLIENPNFLSSDLFNQFLKSINLLRPNLGPLMLQFEYLNKQKMRSIQDFIALLSKFNDGRSDKFQLGIETRNPNYLSEEYFTFLQNQKLVPILLQGYYMPPITDTFRKFGKLLSDTVVIRLHGPDRKGIEEKTGGDWSAIVEPKDSELEEIVNMVLELLDRKVDVYINVNNHYEGSAPLTIEKIIKLITPK
ncbi:MAG: DUF72 domain-containing protein [Bacteroidota bacterium]